MADDPADDAKEPRKRAGPGRRPRPRTIDLIATPVPEAPAADVAASVDETAAVAAPEAVSVAPVVAIAAPAEPSVSEPDDAMPISVHAVALAVAAESAAEPEEAPAGEEAAQAEPASPAEASPAPAEPIRVAAERSPEPSDHAAESRMEPSPEARARPELTALLQRPWIPAVGGGVIGAALIGIAALVAAALGLIGRTEDRGQDIAALANRLAAVEAQAPRLQAVEAAFGRVEPRLATGEKTATELAGFTGRVEEIRAANQHVADDLAGLRSDLSKLRDEIKTLEDRTTALSLTPAAPGSSTGAPAPETLAGDVTRLRQALAALDQRVARLDPAAIDTQLREMRSEIGKARDSAQAALAQTAPHLDRTAALAVTASALKAAIDRGGPFQTELESLRALGLPGVDVTNLAARAAIGVPSPALLAERFKPLARTLIDAATPRPDGLFDRVMQSASRLVSVRPVGDVPGSDVSAVVARIEVKLDRGDLAGAFGEFSGLPDASKAAATSFAADLAARVDADRLMQAVTAEILKSVPKG